MHLGLARTALLGWLRARQQGGSFVLRTEDLDAPRVVPGADARLLADLSWLGLDWDEGPDVGGAHAPYAQSDRLALYQDAITTLTAAGRIYPCSCTRKELSIASAPHGPSEFGPTYPGTCRSGPTRDGGPLCSRFLAPDSLPVFEDGLLGAVAPTAHGDFVVQRADGTFSYQLAVVVDDIAMQISEVVRGRDLAGCTGWQLALYRALGANPPTFVHVPLLLAADGKRLATRDGALSIAELRTHGVEARTIVGALAESVGLVPEGTRCAARELVSDFALSRVADRPVDWARALSTRH
jgi:glutamyl-tRNA synthetase